MSLCPLDGFQPTLLGTIAHFEDVEKPGMITDEDEESIFIESDYFTGTMLKSEYFDLLGVPE